MIVSTVLNLVIVPVIYVLIAMLRDRVDRTLPATHRAKALDEEDAAA